MHLTTTLLECVELYSLDNIINPVVENLLHLMSNTPPPPPPVALLVNECNIYTHSNDVDR